MRERGDLSQQQVDMVVARRKENIPASRVVGFVSLEEQRFATADAAKVARESATQEVWKSSMYVPDEEELPDAPPESPALSESSFSGTASECSSNQSQPALSASDAFLKYQEQFATSLLAEQEAKRIARRGHR